MAIIKVMSRNVRKLLACKSYAVNVTAKQSVWTGENIVRSPFADVEIPNRTLPEHIWENLDRWSDKKAMESPIMPRPDLRSLHLVDVIQKPPESLEVVESFGDQVFMYSDGLGSDYGSLMNNKLKCSFINNCSPGASFNHIISIVEFGFIIDNYNIYSLVMRTRAIHGGSLIICKKSIKCKERKDIVGLSIERVIELSCVELERFVIVSVYRPPASDYNTFESTMEEVLRTICGLTNRSITYHQLYKYSRNFAAQLRTKFNIVDKDVVYIMMGNVPEYAPVLLGAIEAGAEVTTVNPIYTPHEVRRQLSLSNPKVLIGTPESIPILKEAMKLAKKDLRIITCNAKDGLPYGTTCFQELIDESNINHDVLKEVNKISKDVIILPYSSGTTGLPKGVELTNRNIVANCVQHDGKEYRHYNETTNSYQESVMAVLPFYHIYGMVVVMLHKLSVGAKVVTLPKFEPSSFIKALEEHKISLLCAAPPLVLFLATYPKITSKQLESLAKIICGAAPLPKADIDNVLAKAKHHIELLQVYGLTETSALVTMVEPGSKNVTSAGRPIANTELRIVDSKLRNLGPKEVGELHIRGPQVMKGYRNNPEATQNAITEDGWFKSGDLGSLSEDGSFTIADRLKELIKVKGYQVPPAELEGVIKEHPDVLDVGVIGVPDQKAGEMPRAFVVLKDGRKTNPKDIHEFVAKRVAEYKKLKDVMFLESLPKNPSGKLLRRVLREKYSS